MLKAMTWEWPASTTPWEPPGGGLDPAKTFCGDSLQERLPAILRAWRWRAEAWHRGSLRLGPEVDPFGSPHQAMRTRQLLSWLGSATGLSLDIATASARVVDDLALLVQLDQRHTVTVTLGLRSPECLRIAHFARSGQVRDLPSAMSRLAEEGLTVRLSCAFAPELPPAHDAWSPIFELARRAGAIDILSARSLAEPLATQLRQRRLEHGFPRGHPGRG